MSCTVYSYISDSALKAFATNFVHNTGPDPDIGPLRTPVDPRQGPGAGAG